MKTPENHLEMLMSVEELHAILCHHIGVPTQELKIKIIEKNIGVNGVSTCSPISKNSYLTIQMHDLRSH